MKWLVCVLVVCAAAQAEFVSAGGGVKLYESDNEGSLTFTLANENRSAVVQYRIETWSSHERGPVRRSCAIDADKAQIAPHTTVKLPGACKLSPGALSHSSRIVAVRLADGSKWHEPITYKLR